MNDNVKSNFYRTYEDFTDLDFERLYRVNLGKFSLKEKLENSIQTIVYITKSSYDNKDRLSNSTAIKVTDGLRKIIHFYERVKKYTENEFIISNNELVEEFYNIYDTFLELLPTIKAIEKNDEDGTKIRDDIDKLKKEFSDTEDLKSKLTHLDERYSEIVPNLEIIKQREIFKKEAKQSKDDAQKWLIGIVASFCILLIIISTIFNNFCFELKCLDTTNLASYNQICDNCGKTILWLEIIKALLFRLLLISISIYAATFTIRNYNNSMHNHIVNKHKQNSFEAALVLIEHTEKNKDEIISKAAEAIFTQQKTGYLGKADDQISASILETILGKIKS